MPRLYIDDFEVTLAAPITLVGATTITLATGTGSQLASLSLSVSNFLPLVITNGTTVETVWATGRSGDDLTVIRAQEGTTAALFPAGSTIGCYPTAAAFQELQFPRKLYTLSLLTAVRSEHQFTIADANATTARRVVMQVEANENLDLDELYDYTVRAAVLTDGTISGVLSSLDALVGDFLISYTLE